MYPQTLTPDLQTMTVHYLADGDPGAEQTVDDMRGLIDQALKNPRVYVLAREIVQSVPAYDDAGELRAVYNWVLSHIRFVKGTIGKQSLQSVNATLDLRQGQCTDISSLMAALLMSIGYPVKLIAVDTPDGPGQLGHIYPEVKDEDGEWIPVDAARASAQFGVPPRSVSRREEFEILDRWGNMPRLGQTTADDIANVIEASGQSAADIIAAANQPQTVYVERPSSGLGTLLLWGIGAIAVYWIAKKR